MRRNHHAFTLVELLVVIGIIALLISALLPTLNKARQAGNLVDCQARLQQMGQALNIYTAQNQARLPWGGVMNDKALAPWIDGNVPNAGNRETFWWWFFTLSEVTNKNLLGADGFVHNLSPLFKDRDTIDAPDGLRWVNHYVCNPRVLYRSDVPDDAPFYFGVGVVLDAKDLSQRKITSVRHTSDVFVIWDGPQLLDQSSNTYGIAEAIDSWGWYNTGLVLDAPGSVVDRQILPGQLGVSGRQPGKAFQRKYNFDSPTAYGALGWLSHLRFRHMNNTRLAALCLDGHVETRGVGEVKVRDIFTNYK